MVMKNTLSKGFTLVELLIVIALLGVIATIVIAAINPIEQANRAADSGMKADSSQIVSALQRYYTTHSQFPWNIGGALEVDDELAFISADDVSVGICGDIAANCKTSATKGELLNALELQNTFLNKSWINNSSNQGKLWVGKAAGASSSVFVCWSPKSNSNRQVLITSATTGTNRLFDISGFAASGMPSAGACAAVNDIGWTTGACVECVPE